MAGRSVFERTPAPAPAQCTEPHGDCETNLYPRFDREYLLTLNCHHTIRVVMDH